MPVLTPATVGRTMVSVGIHIRVALVEAPTLLCNKTSVNGRLAIL